MQIENQNHKQIAKDNNIMNTNLPFIKECCAGDPDLLNHENVQSIAIYNMLGSLNNKSEGEMISPMKNMVLKGNESLKIDLQLKECKLDNQYLRAEVDTINYGGMLEKVVNDNLRKMNTKE